MSGTAVEQSALHLLGSLVAARSAAYDIPSESWGRVIDLAIQHGLGPMLMWRLKQDSYSLEDHPAFQPLIESTHETAMTTALLEHARHDIAAALREAGIPTLWLKGAALALSSYPQATLRPMVDLDVLVPYEQREQALGVVRRIGYDFYTAEGRLWASSGDELKLKLDHHYHLKGGAANSAILELHFRLLTHNDEVLSLDQLRWFWEQKQTLRLDNGEEFDTLIPEAHLLYLCAHALLQHGGANLYLLRFFDLYQIITQTELDWEKIVDRAVVLGWTFAVERALRLSMEFFAAPVPQAVLDELVSRRPVYEDVSRVMRLAGGGNRWERVRENLGDLSLRERLTYILPIAFPARSYMRQRYHVRPGRPTWPYYLYRWFDQGRDVAWSIWKRITGQYR